MFILASHLNAAFYVYFVATGDEVVSPLIKLSAWKQRTVAK